MFESVHSCPLDEAAAWLEGDANRTRGEFVLVIPGEESARRGVAWERTLQALLQELPLAQAVKLTCAATGARRKPVYERALAMAGHGAETKPL
jgi:16S rRNA (cytidine1402-2'-O)-methyltransferase